MISLTAVSKFPLGNAYFLACDLIVVHDPAQARRQARISAEELCSGRLDDNFAISIYCTSWSKIEEIFGSIGGNSVTNELWKFYRGSSLPRDEPATLVLRPTYNTKFGSSVGWFSISTDGKNISVNVFTFALSLD